ncbi:prepilin-type cleavage/methylation domain-containing protein [Pseudoduganella sp. FT55W]|uniref:Prepilin-type cleavage/methylation domain-containing protein n=1 Tax=Duganella rivi TaxID=2666083 RepID=A0A7X4GQ72_9BURK|nr:prepilin-type cleavage/methylation domain-containing protein [Duganella rivi]
MEAVIVMVLTGILAGIMVLFIRAPVQNYIDASARAELSDTADLALRRMARELRGALPNSIRVINNGGVWWVQFIPTKAGGQYLSVEDNVPNGTPLSFTDSGARTFNVVGPMPDGTDAITPNNDFIVVYNLGNGIDNADAYGTGNRALVTGVSIPQAQVTMATNPFAVGPSGIANSSADHRFSVVTLPVTFRCAPNASGTGTLARIVNPTFTPAQPTPGLAPDTPLLANNVQDCDFSATQTAALNNAMIGMSLSLARPRAGGAANGLETVTLVHQIHVDNTP